MSDHAHRRHPLLGQPTRLALVAVIALALLPSLGLDRLGSQLALVDLRAWWHHQAGDDSWHPIAFAVRHIEREPPGTLYEDTYFHSSEQFVYSPLSLLVFERTSLPPVLDWHDMNTLNRISWWFVIVMGAATALVFLVRSTRAGPAAPGRADAALRVVLAFAATFLFYPEMKGYGLGNMQVWLNLGYVLALLAWLGQRAFLTGLLLGAAAVVKPQMSLFLLWGLLRRERALILGMLVAVVPLGIASLLAYGWPVHAEYMDLMGVLSRRGESYHASQCVNGLVNRALFLGNNLRWDGSHTQLPYNPFVHAVTVVSSLALIATALLWRRREAARRDPLDFTTAMLSFTMAAPVVFEHHYGFLVPVFWLVLVRILEGQQAPRMTRLAFLALAYFLSANYLYPVRRFAATHLNFLQSYLFFGVIVLLVLMYRLRATAPPRPVAPPVAPAG